MRLLTILASLLLSVQLTAQTPEFIEASKRATADQKAMKLKWDPTRNVYTSNGNVIHIFLYEDGNLLLTGYPTTATEKSKFVVHLYVRGTNKDHFLMEYTGSYSPVFNIESSKNGLFDPNEIQRIDFSIIGPFTGSLQLTLKKQPAAGGNYTTVASTTIAIAKMIHVTIGSGLIYTSLKNPSNIRKVPIRKTADSTLIADDPSGRGMLTLMATFYPFGRDNLMLQSKRFKDHFGVVVGTPISAGSANFNDLFGGIEYDFAIGGSFVGGAHFGRVQKISGVKYKDFKFGETVFDGNLDDLKYKDWGLGFFIGVQVDSRVFAQLFGGNK